MSTTDKGSADKVSIDEERADDVGRVVDFSNNVQAR